MTNVQFSIAVHILTGLAQYRGRVPSRIVSNSVNTTPSFVRRVLAKLSKAGLVKTSTGKSGFCLLAKDPRRVTMLDIYRAVEGPMVIAIHDYPALDSCVVSRRIKPSLKRIQDVVERSVQKSLAAITLASVLGEVEG